MGSVAMKKRKITESSLVANSAKQILRKVFRWNKKEFFLIELLQP